MTDLERHASVEPQIVVLASLDVDVDTGPGTDRERSVAAIVHEWLAGWAHDVEGNDGVLLEIGADRITAMFEDDALAAVGTAIGLQEWLLSHRRASLPRMTSRVAISRGSLEMVQWRGTTTRARPGHEVRGIFGPTARRAVALLEIASPGAILVDSDVVANLALHYVRSAAGRKRGWEGTDYLGPIRDLRRTPTTPPISFYELKWSGEELLADPAAPKIVPKKRNSSDRLTGEISRAVTGGWTVLAETGDYFFFGPDDLVGVSELAAGQKVHFIEKPPLKPGHNRHATAVLVDGSRVMGTVRTVFEDRRYAFIEVNDVSGATQDVFMHADENTWPVKEGQRVAFVVGENVRGVAALEAKPID